MDTKNKATTWGELIVAGEELGIPEKEWDLLCNIPDGKRALIAKDLDEAKELCHPQSALMMRTFCWLDKNKFKINWEHPNKKNWVSPFPPMVGFNEFYNLIKGVKCFMMKNDKVEYLSRHSVICLLAGSQNWQRVETENRGRATRITQVLFYFFNTYKDQKQQLWSRFIREVVNPELIGRTGLNIYQNSNLMSKIDRRGISWNPDIVERAKREVMNSGESLEKVPEPCETCKDKEHVIPPATLREQLAFTRANALA